MVRLLENVLSTISLNSIPSKFGLTIKYGFFNKEPVDQGHQIWEPLLHACSIKSLAFITVQGRFGQKTDPHGALLSKYLP